MDLSTNATWIVVEYNEVDNDSSCSSNFDRKFAF